LEFRIKTREEAYNLEGFVKRIGEDLLVAIWGGERPHIGAVAVAQLRPSLRDQSAVSATASVFCYVAHKEDDIAKEAAESLTVRAADVSLKEKRRVALLVRETPLHKGHLELMTRAADMGAHILPPIPSFYNHPKSIEDIVHQTIGKAFDYFGIEHNLFKRWGGQE
jgi:hypothetical protein